MTLQNLLGDLALDETSQEIAEIAVLLRRAVKLLEASGNVDIANRQRVVLDALTTGLTLSTVTTVSAVNTFDGYDRRQWQDGSRIAYNTGIRQNLSFS